MNTSSSGNDSLLEDKSKRNSKNKYKSKSKGKNKHNLAKVNQRKK
jgi:hypothetical protein